MGKKFQACFELFFCKNTIFLLFLEQPLCSAAALCGVVLSLTGLKERSTGLGAAFPGITAGGHDYSLYSS